MDPFVVLAQEHSKQALTDLGHSALPNAPQQPYVERRRWVRGVIAALRRAKPSPTRQPARVVAGKCNPAPVRST